MSGKRSVPRATHEGVLKLGPIEIACAVLEDGVRVVSERALGKALDRAQPGPSGRSRAKSAGDFLPVFLAPSNLKPFIPSGFSLATFRYQQANNNAIGNGIPATAMLDICDIWTDALIGDALRENQKRTAHAALRISRAFSRAGVLAAIDEATGYERAKGADDYRRVIDQFLLGDARSWRQQFPHELFAAIHRAMGWPYVEGQTNHPSYVAHIINRLYLQMPGEVLPELRRLNPAIEGQRRRRFHQYLNEETGVPTLVVLQAKLQAIAEGSRDARTFIALLKRVFPMPGDQLVLDRVDVSP